MEDIQGLVRTSDKGSKKLLVYFSSAGASDIQGMSKLAPYATDALFIRDGSGKGWYNGPINGLSSGADELAEKLSNRISKYKPENVTMAGSSMGGYASLLFGILLGVGRVVAIGPQILLRPELIHCPKRPAKYDDLTSLIESKLASTEINIWYGAESFLDLFNILRIKETQTLRLHAVSGGMHNILTAFKRRGEMEAFFEHIATGTPFSCSATNPSHVEQILDAGNAFYFENDNKKTIDLLDPIADDANLSAIYFLIGNSFYRIGDMTSARMYFERSAVTCPENYDANYYLGLVLDKMDRPRAAADAFSRSMEFYPSPNGVRISKLASAQYKAGKFSDSIANHKLALELDSRRTTSHFQLGVMLMKQGLNKEALFHFMEHAKVNPTFKATKQHIARIQQLN